MTTAQGKEALRGPAYHQRLLPAHTALKVRQEGQGTVGETARRDLRAQLLEAEAKHFKKIRGVDDRADDDDDGDRESLATSKAPKRLLDGGGSEDAQDTGDDAEESIEAKRRRVLEETREIDADSESDGEEESSEEESDDDEEAELNRELEKIRRERAEQREKEAREKAEEEQEQREKEIAFGNPLLNPKKDFGVKRRWDDDVVFKNQARGTEQKRNPEFVNDLLRSDFHKRFMGMHFAHMNSQNKYVR